VVVGVLVVCVNAHRGNKPWAIHRVPGSRVAEVDMNWKNDRCPRALLACSGRGSLRRGALDRAIAPAASIGACRHKQGGESVFFLAAWWCSPWENMTPVPRAAGTGTLFRSTIRAEFV